MISWSIVLAGMLAAAPPDESLANQPTAIGRPGPHPSAIESPVGPAVQGENHGTDQPPVIATSGLRPQREALPITPRSRAGRFSRSAGADSGSGNLSPRPSSRGLAWWLSTAVGLSIVLTVIYAGGRALRKLTPGLAPDNSEGPIRVLYRTYLNPKQTVCLIRCGDRLLLIGSSGDRMQTLAEITDPEEIDFLKGQCMQAHPRSATRAFKDMFTRDRKSFGEVAEQTAPMPASPPAAPADRDLSRQIADAQDKILAWKARTGT